MAGPTHEIRLASFAEFTYGKLNIPRAITLTVVVKAQKIQAF